MFQTLQQRLLLGIYIFILLSIPVGAFLASEYQTNTKSSAKEQTTTRKIAKVTPKPTNLAAKSLLDLSRAKLDTELPDSTSTNASPAPSLDESPTITTSFGPTLSFSVAIEGRPKGNQTTKLFLGIVEGNLTSNPKFILSFTVDVPASGQYSDLSLAGLNPGTRYSALLKGTTQIATSSAFTMSPAVSNLNEGQPLTLLSGDLNDDNIVNNADLIIAQKAAGATSKSANWNANVDFTLDGIINAFDLGLIAKNMGKSGASGSWTSPLPQVATSSAIITTPSVGSPESSGYWIWVPK